MNHGSRQRGSKTGSYEVGRWLIDKHLMNIVIMD